MNNVLDIRRDNRSRSLFDLLSVFDEAFNRSWAAAPFAEFSPHTFSRMRTDIQENEQAFLLSVDMPGVTKDDIQIQLDGNVLTVSAERQAEKKLDSSKETGASSTQYRKYMESFTLPGTVAEENIEAHYENGVLELYLPKSEAAQPKKIEIQTGKGGFLKRLIGKSNQDESASNQKRQPKH